VNGWNEKKSTRINVRSAEKNSIRKTSSSSICGRVLKDRTRHEIPIVIVLSRSDKAMRDGHRKRHLSPHFAVSVSLEHESEIFAGWR
jgi:hypothetical protein